ncbi:MAG TPA: hypothetical protein PL187_20335 [Caldilinea sp.]|nr:hypothetical protein [Caldilinea sp.]
MPNDDYPGSDRIADFLDAPLPEGSTHRRRFAAMARAYLTCHDVAPMVADSGLDIDDVVAHLTGWRDG